MLCCYFNTSELGKILRYKGLRQLRLISFQWTSDSEQVCGFQSWIFIAKFLRFVFCIVRISDQGRFGVYSQSSLLDRMLLLHSYQRCPQDYCTYIQYNSQMGCCKYCYCFWWYNIWHMKVGSLNSLFLG